MKAVLVGTGGVGAVVALALEYSKQVDVTVVIRSTYDKVVKDGFEFDSVDYGHIKSWRPAHVVRSIQEAAEFGPYDYVVVCTKFIPEITPTEETIRPVVTPGCSIVLIQNGIGNEPPVMEAYPDSYVIGGVTMIGSSHYDGKIKHSTPDEVDFGTLDKRPEAIEATKKLVDIYNASKSKASFQPRLQYRRWCKLVYNSTFNTIAALTGLDTGRLFFSGINSLVVLPAMFEVRKIAEAELGEPLPTGIEQTMLDSDEGQYYEPSMLIDVIKGQPMEIEAILGNVLKIANSRHIDAPILRTVYYLLRGKQVAILEKRGLIKLPAEPFDRKTEKPVHN